MRRAFFICLVLAAANVHAQCGYGTAEHLSVPGHSTSLTVGDLNGDGKPDLVVSGSFPLAIYYGTGSGSFTAGPTLIIPSEAAAIGDVNGDGRADLIVSTFDGNIAVLLGRADGTLGNPAGYPVGGGAFAMVLADFNGDGKLDVAAANVEGNVSIILGKGDGSFGTPVTIPTAAAAASIAAADFNRDGNLDLAVEMVNSSDILVLLGKGRSEERRVGKECRS